MARRLLLLYALAAVLAGAAHGAPPLRLQGTVEQTVFPSAAGRLGVDVYLPAGYRAGGRYPAVYFLHGLPASPGEYALRAPLFASWLDEAGAAAIAVVPQGVRAHDADPEYLDWGKGRDWETALAVDLPAWVDRHFRTIRSASARALIGISAGGYGAVLLGLDHPHEFGVIESWSGYFEPTDPNGTHPLALPAGVGAQSNLHQRVPTLAASLGAHPPVLAFYTGDHDWRFESDNVHFDAELTAAGIPHRFAVYPGAHEWRFWSAHEHDWLAYALADLAPARPAPEPAR
jgi:S-formylglutathione hydrolase FrmB